MPTELIPALLVLLVVATVASAMELRASLRPPVCPRCVHCRHEALARKERDDRDRKVTMQSFWGRGDKDDEGPPPRP